MTSGVPAKEPLRLAPSSSWNVHYDDESCRLSRSFGEGPNQVIFVATRFEPGDDLRLRFVGTPLRTSYDGSMLLKFGPSDQHETVGYFAAKTGNNTPSIVVRPKVRLIPSPSENAGKKRRGSQNAESATDGIGPVTPEQEQAITFIELGRGSPTPMILETRSLGPAMKIMRDCTDKLLIEWGLDDVRHQNLQRRATPTGRPGSWLTPSDYPSAMLSSGRRAIVQFRLHIDAQGDATQCHIQQSTRPEAFDKAVCAGIMRRAKFQPALDAEGQQLASFYINTVIFDMP